MNHLSLDRARVASRTRRCAQTEQWVKILYHKFTGIILQIPKVLLLTSRVRSECIFESRRKTNSSAQHETPLEAHPWCSTTALTRGGRHELCTEAGRHRKRASKPLTTCKTKPQARLSILILSRLTWQGVLDMQAKSKVDLHQSD